MLHFTKKLIGFLTFGKVAPALAAGPSKPDAPAKTADGGQPPDERPIANVRFRVTVMDIFENLVNLRIAIQVPGCPNQVKALGVLLGDGVELQAIVTGKSASPDEFSRRFQALTTPCFN